MAIPGDPGAVEAAADRMARAGAGLTAAGESIRAQAATVTADWTGDAADAAFERIHGIGTAVLVGADAVTDAPRVYRTYAAELRTAQREEAAGEELAAQGRAEQRAAAAQALRAGDRPVLDPGREPALAAAQQASAAAGSKVAEGEAMVAAAVEREAVANRVAAAAIRGITARADQMRVPPVGAQVPAGAPVSPRAVEAAARAEARRAQEVAAAEEANAAWLKDAVGSVYAGPSVPVPSDPTPARPQVTIADVRQDVSTRTQAPDGDEGWLDSVVSWVWEHKVDIALTAALVVPGLGLVAGAARLGRIALLAYRGHRAKALTAKGERLKALNGGRHRVSIDGPAGRWRYDLAGKAHGGVPTPHKVWQPRNPQSPHGWGKAERFARPMTRKDLRVVEKHLRAGPQ